MMKQIVIDAIERVTGEQVSMNTVFGWWVPRSRRDRGVVEIDSLDFEWIMDIVEDKTRQQFNRAAVYDALYKQDRLTVEAFIRAIDTQSPSAQVKKVLRLNVPDVQGLKQRCMNFFGKMVKQK